MSAPAAVQSVTAHIAALQAQLDALGHGVRAADTSDASTGSSSAAEFADALASSSAGSTPTSGAQFAAAALPGSSGQPGLAATVPTVPARPTGAVTGADIVADAKRYLGIPYVWGGESTSGLDCSGLVQKTLGDLGISVPRVAADQAHAGTAVPSLAEARPGDLLFFGDPAYHVAIYAGDNQLIESPEPGKTVHVTNVYQPPTAIRRVVDPGGAQLSNVPAAEGDDAARLTAAGIYPAVALFAGQFAAAERSYGLPSGLLAAVAQQESAGNVSAVSPAGAQGLMQLMPATAAAQGVDAFDPAQAIQAAARIFAQNLGAFHGSVPLALAAYNAGAGAVRQHGGVPPYPETQNYVNRIMTTLAAGG